MSEAWITVRLSLGSILAHFTFWKMDSVKFGENLYIVLF